MEVGAQTLQAFALYAAIAGACAGIGLARDRWAGEGEPLGREGLLATLGLVALALAFSAEAGPVWRLSAGAALLSGLAIMAAAPRRASRPSAGRQVGTLLCWAAIAAALIGAFNPLAAAPHSAA